MKDPYRTLGLPHSASPEEIREAYRTHAMRHHPDRNPGSGDAARFREVQEAYETIGDPERKREYDGSQSAPDDLQGQRNSGSEPIRPSRPSRGAAWSDPFEEERPWDDPSPLRRSRGSSPTGAPVWPTSENTQETIGRRRGPIDRNRELIDELDRLQRHLERFLFDEFWFED